VGKGTIVFPSYGGGAEWGGPAVDPETKIIYVNSNDLPSMGGVAERSPGASRGQHIYMTQCAMCHHADLSGSPPEFPSLKGVGSRHTEKEIDSIVRMGKGRMPSFGGLSDNQLTALVHFVLGTESKREQGGGEADPEAKYYFTGYDLFLDPDGYPAVKPPWGTLNAINLDTGEYVWKIPFGEYPELVAQGIKNTGSDNYGGPAVTAGGLLFIGATSYDKKFHAYDKSTGELLWETTLPFSANDTPAIYEIKGRQYVAIGVGGGGLARTPTGGMYAAFALPQ
jgi:quinoprotein glucose dehydrogenase